MAWIELRKYVDSQENCPFDRWLERLADRAAKARIGLRIDRLALGLEGDWKPIAEGVRELRVATGPGYRIYYAWDGPALVILLCGGDKSSQVRDIARAVAYWRDYRGQ